MTMPSIGADVLDDNFDRPKEACGVVGLWTHRSANIEVARNLFFSLYALQHRGQESAGICTSDRSLLYLEKGLGLVSQVFNEENLRPLTGHFGIAHNRYSTTGGNHIANVQPFYIQTLHGPIAVAHNGNLTNAQLMREALMRRGVGFISSSDTEVITQFLARPSLSVSQDDAKWEARLTRLMAEAEGAFSLVVLTRDGIYAMRDPHGLRPLCLGAIKDDKKKEVGWIAASESCALLTIGASFVREVRPGEIVRIDDDGIHTIHEPALQSHQRPALCIFEYVYFARPDSTIDGQNVHVVRQRLGQQLAREAGVADADAVIGVPDSSLVSAMAYAAELGVPYTEGLIKNRYIQRTFIQPSQRLRKDAVRLKFNALRENLEGKKVVLVDDSIVRGTTMGPLVNLVRQAGKAKEVHVRVAAPPIKHPCFMGVDLASHEELIAHKMDVAGIAEHVGADSLAYLTVEGLQEAVLDGRTENVGHCTACFTGKYPVDVSDHLADQNSKMQFEAGRVSARGKA